MLTDAQEVIFLNHINGYGVSTIPVNVYLALHIGGGLLSYDTGSGLVEPEDSNYARVRVEQDTLWSPAYTDAEQKVVAHNLIQIDFPQAAADYLDQVTHIVELDSPTGSLGSNVRRIYPLLEPKTVLATRNLRIPIGRLRHSIGRPLVNDVEINLSDVSVVV